MMIPGWSPPNWRIRVGTVGSWVCLAFVFFVPIANFTALGMGWPLGFKLIVPQLVALTLQHACFRLRRKGWSMQESQAFVEAMSLRDTQFDIYQQALNSGLLRSITVATPPHPTPDPTWTTTGST